MTRGGPAIGPHAPSRKEEPYNNEMTPVWQGSARRRVHRMFVARAPRPVGISTFTYGSRINRSEFKLSCSISLEEKMWSHSTRRNNRLPRRILVIAALALVLITAAPAAAQTPTAPTTFKIAQSIDLNSLDPAGQTTVTVANMLQYVVETLYGLDQDGKIIPVLAKEMPDISTDGLTFTIKLRDGIKFHDGTPFNAAAVKANLERVLDKDTVSPGRAPYTVISQIDAVDASTVKFTLSKRSMTLTAALTWLVSGMVSPASIQKGSPAYKTVTQPVGTGPYAFKEFIKGTSFTVTKFADYWGKKPYYDTVVFSVIPEAATRESLLLAGQVDMMILPPASDIAALQKNSAVKVIMAPSNRAIFIAINNQKKPFDDVRVRQALNYAVNKEDIVKNVLIGAADILDSPMPSMVPSYCKAGAYAYDPAKAKQLLKDAGVAPGTQIKMNYPTGRFLMDAQAAQAIGAYFKEAGLEPVLNTMDWPSYIAMMTKPQAERTEDVHMFGWSSFYPDASGTMEPFQSSLWPPAGFATSFYKNAKTDELLTNGISIVDQKQRDDTYCQAQKQIWDDAAMVFLWNQRFPIVHSAKVQNIGYRPNETWYSLDAEPVK